MTDKIITIETRAGLLEVDVQLASVKIKMPQPHSLVKLHHLDVAGLNLTIHEINTGVPHVVLFYEEIDNINIMELGKNIRWHKRYLPVGTNVNFVQIIDSRTIYVRTYERGVENEVLSCGTGCVASALIAHDLYQITSPITTQVRHRNPLHVIFDSLNNNFDNIWLQGTVEVISESAITL